MTDLEHRNTQPEHVYAALGFTCEEAIRTGLLDPWLMQLWRAIRYRQAILDRTKVPTIPLPPGVVWVWQHDTIYHEGDAVEPPGHWAPAGTGLVLDNEDEVRTQLGRPLRDIIHTRKDPTHA